MVTFIAVLVGIFLFCWSPVLFIAAGIGFAVGGPIGAVVGFALIYVGFLVATS
jgi:hypothetical protein